MKLWFCGALALLLSATGCLTLCRAAAPSGFEEPAAQTLPRVPSRGVRLPNGKLQRDEILKADHEQNLKDAARLAQLAEQLQQELKQNDAFVLPLATLKKTDEIEKLVKKIRTRMRHD